LHDAIQGNLGADDNFPHGSLSLSEPRTNGPLPSRHGPTLINIVSQQYYAISKRLGFDEVHIPSVFKHVGSLTPRRWADS
jgi:hypothetical protein